MALTITIPGAVEATIGATAPAILTVGVGVPGATGPTGATGAQGPQGDPGEGVPVGGSAGQVLAKIDGTNYNTEWVNVEGDYLPLAGGAMDANASITASDTGTDTDSELAGWGLGVQLSADHTKGTTVEFNGLDTYDGASHMQVTPTGITFPDSSVQSVAYPGDGRPLTDYDFTNVADTKLTGFGMTLNPPVGTTSSYDSYLSPDSLYLKQDDSGNGTQPGSRNSLYASSGGFIVLNQTWEDDGSGGVTTDGGKGFYLTPSNGLSFTNGSGASASGTIIYNRTSITFGNASVQTIAFPGFAGYATLASPAFTGNPTAPTPALADNDTSIATTAFVQQELASGVAVAKNLEVYVRNQTGSTIPIGSIVYINGATGNRPTITLAQANNDANSAQTIGFTKTAIANNGFGFVIIRGELEGLNTNSLTEGVQLYLSPTTAGTWTTTKPSAPEHLVYVGIVIRAHPTLGVILVSVQNGYELAEIHDVALASVADNDLLTYESSTDLWKNKSFATLGLAGLNSPTFTGTPSLPTGTTAVTQTAGNNTTALATTAFVTTSNPDASTTVKGHVELATNAEAQLGSSDTTSITPAANYWADKRNGHSYLQFASFTATTSGAGSSAGIAASGYVVTAPTSVAGSAVGAFSYSAAQRGLNRGNGSWNWSKRFTATFRYARLATASDTNSISRVTFGKTITAGDPVSHCVGIRMSGSSALQLIVHNGTTLTPVTTTSSIVPTVPITTDMRIVSDGAGNVSLYVNDVLEATTSAGPTGTSGTASATLVDTEAQNAAIITGIAASHAIYNLHFEFAD